MNKGLEALEKGFWKLTHKGNIKFYNVVENELKEKELLDEENVGLRDKNAELAIENSTLKKALAAIKEITELFPHTTRALASYISKEKQDLLEEVLNNEQ